MRLLLLPCLALAAGCVSNEPRATSLRGSQGYVEEIGKTRPLDALTDPNCEIR
jgi:hypothetical protein